MPPSRNVTQLICWSEVPFREINWDKCFLSACHFLVKYWCSQSCFGATLETGRCALCRLTLVTQAADPVRHCSLFIFSSQSHWGRSWCSLLFDCWGFNALVNKRIRRSARVRIKLSLPFPAKISNFLALYFSILRTLLRGLVHLPQYQLCGQNSVYSL